MFVPNVVTYKKNCATDFTGAKFSSLSDISDLRVFSQHLYEYKKGVRNLILTTEKSKHKNAIAERLDRENIDYIIHDVDKNKINVYFGAKECIDVVKSFDNTRLNELTAEQDFMLGIMLGYDRVKQCERYLKIKNNIIKLGKRPPSSQNQSL